MLKDHNDRKDEVRKNVRQHPRNSFQPNPPREIKEGDDQRESHRHLNGSGTFDEDEKLVDDGRDNKNVQHSDPRQMRY